MISSAELQPDTILYMDGGEREFAWAHNPVSRFAAVASQMAQKGVAVTARVVPGGEHSEASWERQIPYFIDVLFYELEGF